jgi:hypothetical protein
MTFYPEAGPWSQEDFTVPDGIILDTFQTVTGGFFALRANVSGSSNFIKRWSNITSWSFTNTLNTINIISGSFLRLSGSSITGQVVPEGKLGYQSLVTQAGAYKIDTPIPFYEIAPEFTGYSGQTRQCFMLSQDSPNKSWFNFFSAGNPEATIEFDVASIQDIYSGAVSIGFNTGQALLSTLPAIRTPYVGHGIYIDNGQYWDYLEINPFGIRSINHPEFGLPIDLNYPKRIRLGINAQNLILTTENGRGVLGRSVLDTPVQTGSDAKIIFGAPPISGVRNRFPFNYYGISGVVGTTLWDNVRILYGSSQLTANTGLSSYYTTSAQTGFTSTYEPGIPLTNWNSAVIGFLPGNGSATTTVVLQYSGVTGWADGPSKVLSTQSSPQTLNLSTVPVFYNSRAASTHGKIQNPIRFKILQQSDGKVPPPPLDYISFSASTEKSILDLTPNWRPINLPIDIIGSIKETIFDSTIAYPTRFSTYVLNSPVNTGLLLNSIITVEDSAQTGNVFAGGYVDVIQAGNNSTALRSFCITGLTARQGSEAERLLGGNPVDNCFYNSSLDSVYNGITGSPNYVARRSFGELAGGLKLVPSYTGRSIVTFGKKEVFRTIDQANNYRSNYYQGAGTQQTTSFVQSVVVPKQETLNPDGSINYHDYSCGFEAVVPSGICSGRFIYSLDLQVEKGSQLYIYASGNNVSGNPGWVVDGNNFRVFRNISFPVSTQNNSGEVYLGVVVNSGVTGLQEFIYNVDNVKFIPYHPGWIYSTGISTYSHQSGLLRDVYAGVSTIPAVRSATCVGFDTYLHGYPSGNNSILVQKTRSLDNKGFRLYCTKEGYLAADVDVESQSWAYNSSSLSPFTGSVISTGLVSSYRMQAGRWINVGLVHQADTYNRLGYASYSGASIPANFASTNKLYLLVDGYPVGALDLMKNWNNGSQTLLGDKTPYLSYICDGVGTVTLASGILADIDAVQISRPAIADSEIDYSIKIAKGSRPYFVPEVYFKPTATTGVKNYLIDGSADYALGNDFFLGSIYNFDGPGFTNWDHGPWKNHLLYYGDVLKVKGSPYDPTGRYGFSSTYIPNGSYAIANYSSAMDRQYNNYSNLQQTNPGISGNLQTGGTCNNSLKILGWVYPFESGKDFFHVYENDQNFSGRKLSLGYTQDMKLRVHLASGNTDIWARTGATKHNISGWNFVGLYASLGDYTGHNTTGTNSVILVSNKGQDLISLNNIVGLNYGFQYYGRSGSPSSSCIVFGGSGTFAYSDFAISTWHTGDRTYLDSNIIKKEIYRGKSGRYTVPMQNSDIYTGPYEISGFNNISITVSGKTSAREDMFWIAAHNSYDNSCRLNGGIHLFDDEPFRQVESYYLSYDTSSVTTVIGSNYSPIKIGNQVPKGAVNLARITSPNFNTESSISNIDLAGYNINNLLAYKGGEYPVERGKGALSGYSYTGSFKRINSGLFTGRADIEMSGQVYSDNIYVTPLSISSINSNTSSPAYFYYLVGRGRYGVRVPDAGAHPDIFYSGFTTGNVVSDYFDNIQKIKNSISIKNSAGQPIEFEEYPFDIVTSPHTPENLYEAIQSGLDININGITRFSSQSGYFTDKLPTGVFSVILLLNDTYKEINDSAWVHYPAFDFEARTSVANRSEVINPSPIMRRNTDGEVPLPGRFSTLLDSESLLYTLKVFGVDGEYTGKF